MARKISNLFASGKQCGRGCCNFVFDMGKTGKKLEGIPSIYRATAIDLVLFGAIKLASLQNPDKTLLEIVREALSAFGLKDTVTDESAKLIYMRMQSRFVNNNGI